MISLLRNRFLSVFFVLAFALNCNTAASDSLKVMTYNIQGMKPGTDPDTRLTHIIENLKELDPDILAIQEINETLTDTSTNQMKIIADSLSAHFGMEYYYFNSFTHLSWSNAFREFVGVISKHPIIYADFKQLPPGLFIRKVVWSNIDTPIGIINFFSTHLSFTNTDARINQVEEITPYVEYIEQNFPAAATVLAGDFNDIPNSEPITMLTGSGSGDYTDTFSKIHPFGNPGYTQETGNLTRRIDYVFYKKNGSLQISDSYTAMEEPYSGNLYCSDHLAVMTIFKTDPTDVAESEYIPIEYKLYQNYPNPFNPSTVIKYSLPKKLKSMHGEVTKSGTTTREKSEVRLIIYDVLGKEVATLVNEEQTSGVYEVKWDAADYPSGIYFYTFTAGKISTTRKLILIK